MPKGKQTPMRRVVIFGAGDPLAAAAARALTPSYRLRLTDVRPPAAVVAEARPQSPGACANGGPCRGAG